MCSWFPLVSLCSGIGFGRTRGTTVDGGEIAVQFKCSSTSVLAGAAILLSISSALLVFTRQPTASASRSEEFTAAQFFDFAPEYHLGTVIPGLAEPKIITATNVSNRRLRLTIIESSCSCISATADPQIVPPGATGRLSLLMDTTSSSTPKSKLKILAQEVPDTAKSGTSSEVSTAQQTYSIVIQAVLSKNSGVTAIEFDPVTSERPDLSGKFSLKIPASYGIGEKATMTPLQWPSHFRLTRFETVEDRAGCQIEGTVKLIVGEIPGSRKSVHERLRFNVQSGQRSLEFFVTANAVFQEIIEVTPQLVYCRKSANETPQIVVLKHRDAREMTVLSADANIDGIAITTLAPESAGCRLAIRYTRKDVSSGITRGAIVVNLAVQGQSENVRLEVPLIVN